MVIQNEGVIKPQMESIVPTQETAFKTLMTGSKWEGTVTTFRFSQTRSPNTALEAQFFVDRGFLNSRGLIHIQITDRVMGMIDHHPIPLEVLKPYSANLWASQGICAHQGSLPFWRTSFRCIRYR